MSNLPYRYFVSYSHSGPTGSNAWGFGNSEICRDIPIDDIDGIKSIKATLESDNNLRGVIILNVQPFPIGADSAKEQEQ